MMLTGMRPVPTLSPRSEPQRKSGISSWQGMIEASLQLYLQCQSGEQPGHPSQGKTSKTVLGAQDPDPYNGDAQACLHLLPLLGKLPAGPQKSEDCKLPIKRNARDALVVPDVHSPVDAGSQGRFPTWRGPGPPLPPSDLGGSCTLLMANSVKKRGPTLSSVGHNG